MKNKKEATSEKKMSDIKKPAAPNTLSEITNAVIGLIVVSAMAGALIWMMSVLL